MFRLIKKKFYNWKFKLKNSVIELYIYIYEYKVYIYKFIIILIKKLLSKIISRVLNMIKFFCIFKKFFYINNSLPKIILNLLNKIWLSNIIG